MLSLSTLLLALVSQQTGAELQLWQDPKFRQRLVESYVAETDLEPSATQDEREQIQSVLALMAADKMDEAAVLLDRHRTPASSAQFDFLRGGIHFQKDQFAEAGDAYAAAVAKHPKFRRAWRQLGLARARQGSYDRALPALTKVIELGGADANSYGLLGYAYAIAGNHLAAESAYRMANLLDPANFDWKLGMAESFFRQKRYADAAALCGLLLEAHPDNATFWLLQANAYVGLGQPMLAAQNFELLDRLGKASSDNLYLLGDIYTNQSLPDLAAATYLRALAGQKDPNPARALRAAKDLAARGALPAASLLVTRVETAHADFLGAAEQKDLLRLRARIAVAAGAIGEEVAVLEEIVALDPLDGEALILLGQHAQRGGDPEQAVFYFERAAGIEAFEADAKVRHAQLLVGQGKYAEALPLLRRAQQIEPRDKIQEYLEQVERVAKSRS